MEQESLQAEFSSGEFMPVEEKLEALACLMLRQGRQTGCFSAGVSMSLCGWPKRQKPWQSCSFFIYWIFEPGEVAEDEFLAVVYQRLEAAVKPAELVICRDGTKFFLFYGEYK